MEGHNGSVTRYPSSYADYVYHTNRQFRAQQVNPARPEMVRLPIRLPTSQKGKLQLLDANRICQSEVFQDLAQFSLQGCCR